MIVSEKPFDESRWLSIDNSYSSAEFLEAFKKRGTSVVKTYSATGTQRVFKGGNEC